MKLLPLFCLGTPLAWTLTLALTILASLSAYAQTVGSSSSNSSSNTSGPDPDALRNSILEDRNGNGTLELEAFGDSITRGIGDFVAVGEEDVLFFPDIRDREAGYPLRVETLLGLPVKNAGIPGEILSTEGLERLIRELPQRLPDTLFISGGANDANERASTSDYASSLQTMINFARALGINPVLVTTPPTCCEHDNLTPYIDAYVTQMRYLAVANELPLADAYQAFRNTCNPARCQLLNLPEGLHPNIEGYDVMGEAVLASIFRIDLSTATGAAQLESALNLPTGSVKTKPSPSPGI